MYLRLLYIRKVNGPMWKIPWDEQDYNSLHTFTDYVCQLSHLSFQKRSQFSRVYIFLFYYYDEFLTSLAMFLIGFIVFIEQTASSGEGEIAFINSKHDRYCAWTHVQYSIYLFSQWSKVNIKFSRDIRELQSVMNHFDEIIACYFIKSLLKAAVAATLF